MSRGPECGCLLSHDRGHPPPPPPPPQIVPRPPPPPHVSLSRKVSMDFLLLQNPLELRNKEQIPVRGGQLFAELHPGHKLFLCVFGGGASAVRAKPDSADLHSFMTETSVCPGRTAQSGGFRTIMHLCPAEGGQGGFLRSFRASAPQWRCIDSDTKIHSL